jgi:hypothetical protein
VSPRVRWEYGLLYVGLIAFLAYMTNDVQRQLSGVSRYDNQQQSGEVWHLSRALSPPRRPAARS